MRSAAPGAAVHLCQEAPAGLSRCCRPPRHGTARLGKALQSSWASPSCRALTPHLHCARGAVVGAEEGKGAEGPGALTHLSTGTKASSSLLSPVPSCLFYKEPPQ